MIWSVINYLPEKISGLDWRAGDKNLLFVLLFSGLLRKAHYRNDCFVWIGCHLSSGCQSFLSSLVRLKRYTQHANKAFKSVLKIQLEFILLWRSTLHLYFSNYSFLKFFFFSGVNKSFCYFNSDNPPEEFE